MDTPDGKDFPIVEIIRHQPREIKSSKFYSTEFLNGISQEIGLTASQDIIAFSNLICLTGNQFAHLKKANKTRVQFSMQKAHLDAFQKGLQAALAAYEKIYAAPPTSTKLEISVRKKYNDLDAWAKEMFHPYCTESGLATEALASFLRHMILAAKDAKELKEEKEKAKLDGVFLTEWLTVIGKAWPSAARMTFSTGKYDKETRIHASPIIPILRLIRNNIQQEKK